MILLVDEKDCEEVCPNCSRDWLGNNEQTKSAMKPSPKTKELQHKGVQQNVTFNPCERGGYEGWGGGGGVHLCIPLKLLVII